MSKQRTYATLNTRLIAFMIDMLLYTMMCMPILLAISHHLIYSAPPEPIFAAVAEEMRQEMASSNATTMHASLGEFWHALRAALHHNTKLQQFLHHGGMIRLLLDQALQIFPLLAISALFHKKLGSTPGKWLFGIKVVDAHTGALLGWHRAVLREIATILSALPLTIGVISMRFQRQRQMWHDRIAHSIVIKR